MSVSQKLPTELENNTESCSTTTRIFQAADVPQNESIAGVDNSALSIRQPFNIPLHYTGKIVKTFKSGTFYKDDGKVVFEELPGYMKDKMTVVLPTSNKNKYGYIDVQEELETSTQIGLLVDDETTPRPMQKTANSQKIKEDLLQLQSGWTLNSIFSLWEHIRVKQSNSAFIRQASLSCYFGYAPVWEAEISYRDFLPTFGSATGVSTIDIGAPAAQPGHGHRSAVRTIDSLLSGALAGTLSRTCTAPLDRLKVMRQVYGYQHAGTSAVSAFRWMLREGGVRSLWRGNGVNVLKIAPETAVKYTAYDVFKGLLLRHSQEHQRGQQLPIYEKFLAGSLAGATSQTLIYPLEVVKTRLCLRKTGQFGGAAIANCLAAVYREGGLRAFYRGYSVNLAGILPYAGIELATYETVRSRLQRRPSLSPPGGGGPEATAPATASVAAPLLAGAVASSLGIVTCYPLALLRTKLQSKVRFSRPELDSVRGLVGTIYRAEGLAGFYRGMGANLLKVLPSVAISFAVFERVNRYLLVEHSLEC